MKIFTHEETRPTEATLHVIRQIAYAYRTAKDGDEVMPLCLN